MGEAELMAAILAAPDDDLGITGNSLGTGEYTTVGSWSDEAGEYDTSTVEVHESTASLAARFGGRVRIE